MAYFPGPSIVSLSYACATKFVLYERPAYSGCSTTGVSVLNRMNDVLYSSIIDTMSCVAEFVLHELLVDSVCERICGLESFAQLLLSFS